MVGLVGAGVVDPPAGGPTSSDTGGSTALSLSDIFTVADRAGTVVILLLVIVGGLRGWWVFGSSYNELKSVMTGEAEELKAELRDARTEIRAFNDKQLELIRQMAPLLSDATRALGEVQTGMEAAIKRRPYETDSVLRRLEAVVRDIEERGQ